jgi:hypothetical protein
LTACEVVLPLFNYLSIVVDPAELFQPISYGDMLSGLICQLLASIIIFYLMFSRGRKRVI